MESLPGIDLGHKAKGRAGSSKAKTRKAKSMDAIGEIMSLMSEDKDENEIIIGKLDVKSTVEYVLKQIKTDKAISRGEKQMTKEQAQKLAIDMFRTTSMALWDSLEKQLEPTRTDGNRRTPHVIKEGKLMHVLRVDEFLARAGVPISPQRLLLPAGENLKGTARFDDETENVIRWLVENEPSDSLTDTSELVPKLNSWVKFHRQVPQEDVGLMSTVLV